MNKFLTQKINKSIPIHFIFSMANVMLTLFAGAYYLLFPRKKVLVYYRATPSIFAYLMCTVPSIWVMEYKGYERRLENSKHNFTSITVDCSNHLSDFGDTFTGAELKDKVSVIFPPSTCHNLWYSLLFTYF